QLKILMQVQSLAHAWMASWHMLSKQAAHWEPDASDAAKAVRLASTEQTSASSPVDEPVSAVASLPVLPASLLPVLPPSSDELLQPVPTADAIAAVRARVPSIQ